jgi:hypothetical protein
MLSLKTFYYNGILQTKLNALSYQSAPTLYLLPSGWSYEKHSEGQIACTLLINKTVTEHVFYYHL